MGPSCDGLAKILPIVAVVWISDFERIVRLVDVLQRQGVDEQRLMSKLLYFGLSNAARTGLGVKNIASPTSESELLGVFSPRLALGSVAQVQSPRAFQENER